jgi:hypothetical protein
MKLYLIISLCFLCLNIDAQDANAGFDGHKWKPPYSLPLPAGWTVERFQVPPAFAPAVAYKGVEDIRFTPGWSDAKSNDYWSYAFLWWLDELPVISAGIVETKLTAYYTGLITVANQVPVKEAIPVVCKFKEVATKEGDKTTYTGTVEMLDYMTKKPITLQCMLHVKFCNVANKAALFFELSPKPVGDKVWQSLDELWKGFLCVAN